MYVEYSIPRKGQAMSTQQSNPHRAAHYAGWHPEDQPFMSDALEDDPSYYVTRQPTSARRYSTPARYVVHQGPAPVPVRAGRKQAARQPVARAKRRWHWLTWVGIVFLIATLGALAFTALSAWWQGVQDNWQYGTPRTFQTDAVVGHGDSAAHPSHFIAMNLDGEIVVVEFPGGDVSKARSYSITTLPGGDSYPPVSVAFKDTTGDGRLDLVVQIGDPGSVVQVVLLNNGSQFGAKA